VGCAYSAMETTIETTMETARPVTESLTLE
jgi:hypothetical protein